MAYVAVTLGFAALGAYLGRDLSGATGLVLFVGAFASAFGLNIAAASVREQLADDEQARRVKLLLPGEGAVISHRFERSLAAESDESEQSPRGDRGDRI